LRFDVKTKGAKLGIPVTDCAEYGELIRYTGNIN
jgi:hypothetical protein